jgi:hypothetical protein
VIDLPYGFDGYLLLTAPDHVPTEYYFQGPLIGTYYGETTIAGEPIVLYDSASLADQLYFLGVTPQPDSGFLMVRTRHCYQGLSSGVRLELLGTDASGWVMLNGLMVANLDGSLGTDADGIAGFSNIPAPTTAILEGVTHDDCDPNDPEDVTCLAELRFGRTAVRIRPGSMTITELRPDYGYGR